MFESNLISVLKVSYFQPVISRIKYFSFFFFFLVKIHLCNFLADKIKIKVLYMKITLLPEVRKFTIKRRQFFCLPLNVFLFFFCRSDQIFSVQICPSVHFQNCTLCFDNTTMELNDVHTHLFYCYTKMPAFEDYEDAVIEGFRIYIKKKAL